MIEMETLSSSREPQPTAVVTESVSAMAPAIERLRQRMDARIRLATLPTPVHLLEGTSAAQGREVWIKRDDLTGLALGGNKVRKLELILAEAVAQGATALVSVGGQQSNHARTVAAAAAMAGLECHLVLGGTVPEFSSGNLILNELFGATMHFIGEMDSALLASTAQQLVHDLTAAGTQAFLVPLGGSTPLGALAYAAAYLELEEQCRAQGRVIPTIVHASGSGGTQAGLELGRHLGGGTNDIIGVNVAGLVPDLAGHVNGLVREAGGLLGLEGLTVSAKIDERYLGDGYGVPTEQSTAALRELAQRDGIVADPVYTAKALWALDALKNADPVLFWHTGGTPAIFADGVGYRGRREDGAANGGP